MSQEISENMPALPTGWENPPLSELAQINPPLDRCVINDAVEVNFIPMRAVEAEGGGLISPEVRTYREVKKGYTSFLSGDVIMAKITPCMENGKTTVVPDLPDSVCFGSTEFHVVRPESGILPKWVAYFLLQHEVRRAAQRSMAGGVGQMRVPASFVESVRIPLAPISEQHRIVDALDELLSDIDAGEAALERARENLKLYRASVLKAAVDGSLIVSGEKFPWRPIGETIESIGQGWSPKCESRPSINNDTWGVIKTTAIQPLRYLQDQNKQLPTSLEARPHLELAKGDLLITRAGPRSRVGVACLVRETRPRLMLCDKAYRLRVKPNMVTPAFLEVVLNAPQFVDALNRLKTGIDDSGLNLTQKRFAELQVPLPPLPEQEAIAEAVAEHLSIIEHLEAEIDAKLKSAQALRQSTLRHAFTGKLVSQDRNDEPASELLKRIAAEREARDRGATAAKKTGKSIDGLRPKRRGRAKSKAQGND